MVLQYILQQFCMPQNNPLPVVLKKENGDDWKTVVEKGKDEERNEESLLICDYFMHPSMERERRLLDEKRVEWIASRMEMITKETRERFEGRKGVEYRVDQQAVEKKPATKAPHKIEELLFNEQYLMDLLLLYEVKEWEQLFWNKFKPFLDEIGNDRVEEKERLTREWRANCWKRLNPQFHAAQKKWADIVKDKDEYIEDRGERLGERWGSTIGQLFGGVEDPNSILPSELRNEIERFKSKFRFDKEGELL